MTVWCAGLDETHIDIRFVRHVGYLQRLYRDARSTEHKNICRVVPCGRMDGHEANSRFFAILRTLRKTYTMPHKLVRILY